MKSVAIAAGRRRHDSMLPRGATVLVVDEDPQALSLLVETLQIAGCNVLPAGSVGEAVAALEQADVDVVLSNFTLHGGTGLHLLSYCRTRGLSSTFVLTSSAFPPGVEQDALSSGALVIAKAELIAPA